MGMRPIGNPKQLEQRRRKAIALLEQGHGVRETARLVAASPSTITEGRKAYEQYGEQMFVAHSPPGRTAGLSPPQKQQLERLLLKGPRYHGYATELWTLQRVTEVIEKRFGIRYDVSSVWHILNGMGWSCQKPERRARERDEEAIAVWRKADWPRIKKSPKKR
jgi:transposase